MLNKSLLESQDEINEMKRNLKVMNHQIDQLKVCPRKQCLFFVLFWVLSSDF